MIPHGTVRGYNTHKCKCERCTAAKRKYMQDRTVRRRAEGVTCILEWCDRPAPHTAMCPGHDARWRDGVDLSLHMERRATYGSDEIGYAAAHGRVAQAFGSAKTHSCRACGKPAAHWAVDRSAPDLRMETEGREAGCPYSVDPGDYAPMCVRCHKHYDMAATAQ